MTAREDMGARAQLADELVRMCLAYQRGTTDPDELVDRLLERDNVDLLLSVYTDEGKVRPVPVVEHTYTTQPSKADVARGCYEQVKRRYVDVPLGGRLERWQQRCFVAVNR